jgi:hypothetical protein
LSLTLTPGSFFIDRALALNPDLASAWYSSGCWFTASAFTVSLEGLAEATCTRRKRRENLKVFTDLTKRITVPGQAGNPGADEFVALLSDMAAPPAKLDWYERVALSRRKRTIREFDAARRKAPTPDGGRGRYKNTVRLLTWAFVETN